MFIAYVQTDDDEASAPSTRSAASAAAPSPAPPSGGGDMMSEMAKRLRDRKAKAEMNAQANVGPRIYISAYAMHYRRMIEVCKILTDKCGM